MPSIDNFSNKTTAKKFKKTAYRPWTVLEPTEETNLEHDLSKANLPSENISSNNIETGLSATLSERLSSAEIDKPSVNVLETVNKQSDNNSVTMSEQLGSSLPSVHQMFTNQIGTHGNSIYHIKKESGSAYWSVEECSFHLSRLNGLQRNLIIYIGTRAISNNSLSSGPLAAKELGELLGTGLASVKTTAQRLFYKGFITKQQGKSGAGGFAIYNITENMKKAIIDEIQKSQFSFKSVNNQETNRLTKTPSISSSNNTITTNEETNDNSFTDEWLKVNFQALEEIGFNSHHLTQIKKLGGFKPEEVQESINAFAFDLQVNGKAEKLKGSPLNYFMGILRSGVPYAPAENYESPEVKALRNYLERKKREKQEREALEREAFNMAFDDWIVDLSEHQVSDIIPEPQFRDHNSPMRRGGLELYFRNNVWPTILNEIKG